MKTIESIKLCISEVEETLTSIKEIKNGGTLTQAEQNKLKADDVVLWINKAEITDSKRATFIVAKIMSPNSSGRADNRNAFRLLRAYIDILTIKSYDDVKLLNLLAKIEDNFVNKGWKFEMVREAELDTSSNRTTWSFEISKTL